MATQTNKTFNFVVVTPEKILLKVEAKKATIPTKAGEITILPHHIPLVSVLRAGVIEVSKANGEIEIISVVGGFLDVSHANQVTVLADSAERAPEIDLEKAEEAKRRAEELKNKLRQDDNVDFAEVNAAIARELARTQAVHRWRRLKKKKKPKE